MLLQIGAILINAVIMLGAGCFMVLGARGKVRLKKSPEANQEFLTKYSRLLMALGSILILLGVLSTILETVKLFK